MKRLLGGAAHVFTALAVLGYIAMHVYYAYTAFSGFKLWFGFVVTLVPVGGDMLLAGACIGVGNWLPTIAFVAVMALWGISFALSKGADKIAANADN